MEVDGLSVKGVYIILEKFQMFLYKVIFKDLVTFKDHVFSFRRPVQVLGFDAPNEKESCRLFL